MAGLYIVMNIKEISTFRYPTIIIHDAIQNDISTYTHSFYETVFITSVSYLNIKV